MKKWELLDEARTRDGRVLALYSRDGCHAIRIDGIELMSTRQHASEERLAALVCGPLRGKRRARVLIGGLGLGFTLRAALAELGTDATVVVVELLGEVIGWNRNPALPLAARPLGDRRVRVVEGDVGSFLAKHKVGFDAILLDVDNGPRALCSRGNGRLYERAGIDTARRALRENGCVGYWFAGADRFFEKRLRQAGLEVEVHHCRSHGTSGGRHTIFLGRAPA